MMDFWTRIDSSPIYTGAAYAAAFALIAYMVEAYAYRRAVKGTVRSYRAGTILRTLCLPLFGWFVFRTAVDIFTADWMLLIHAWLAYTLLRDWETYKDNDDWWKGKGTKLKKKLRSMLTASAPSAAPAAA